MKVEMENNKFLNQRRVFKQMDYDDYLIVYSQDGLIYDETEELTLQNRKHGWCSICNTEPDFESVSFPKGGRPTGDWDLRTDQAQKDFKNFGKGLYRHYVDPTNSKQHRTNKMKLEGLIDDPMIVVFANLSRCFARVLTMGCAHG
eukprot:294400_1